MPDDSYQRHDDPRPVQVQHEEGHWVDGFLEAQRRNPDGSWRGLVRYTTTPGSTYLQWRDEPDLRRPPDIDQPDTDPGAGHRSR